MCLKGSNVFESAWSQFVFFFLMGEIVCILYRKGILVVWGLTPCRCVYERRAKFVSELFGITKSKLRQYQVMCRLWTAALVNTCISRICQPIYLSALSRLQDADQLGIVTTFRVLWILSTMLRNSPPMLFIGPRQALAGKLTTPGTSFFSLKSVIIALAGKEPGLGFLVIN